MQNWSKRTRLERLLGCITHKAVNFVERLRKDKRRDYCHLLKALDKRYGSVEPPSTIRTQLFAAGQGEKESLDEWADRIYGLTLDGYPGAPEDMVESLAVEQFFRGCRDSRAALAVSQGRKKSTSIAKALKYTKQYIYSQRLLLGKTYNTRQVSFGEATVVSPFDPCGYHEEIKKTINEMGTKIAAEIEKGVENRIMERLTPLINKQTRSTSPYRRSTSPSQIVCFNCRERGHFSKDCPNAQSRGSRSPSPAGGRCFLCNEMGHLKRDCPNLVSKVQYSPKGTGLGKEV